MTLDIRPTARRRLAASLLALFTLSACAAPTQPAASGDRSGEAVAESLFGNYLAGRLAAQERDNRTAARFYEHALADDKDNEALLQRTFLLLLTEGEIERAAELARRQVAERPQTPLARTVLAVRELRQRNWEAARAHAEAAGDTGMSSLLKPLTLAWIRRGLGDTDGAVAALAGLAQNDGFAPFQSFHLALLNDVAGRVDAADQAYLASRRGPAGNATRVVEAYASFLARNGRTTEARSMLEEHLQRFPENPVIAAALAALEAGRPPPPPVDDPVEGVAEAFYGVAAALAQERTSDIARAYLRLALYLKPALDNGLMLLAEMLEDDRRWDDAERSYGAIEKDSPFRWDARVRLAALLNQQDKVNQSVELLRLMAKERPDDVRPLVTLADTLRARERYVEAAEAYDEALARIGEPAERHWSLLYSRGIALERAKRWDRAEADFLKALELKPEQPLVLNYLGYSWLEQGLNLDRALAMIERAVQQRPNDGYIVDSLGWGEYRLGRYEAAVRHLERAVELRPEDPVINDHLGDAYWKVGRDLEARFQWSHALALKPEPDVAEKIKDKLENGLGAATAAAPAR